MSHCSCGGLPAACFTPFHLFKKIAQMKTSSLIKTRQVTLTWNESIWKDQPLKACRGANVVFIYFLFFCLGRPKLKFNAPTKHLLYCILVNCCFIFRLKKKYKQIQKIITISVVLFFFPQLPLLHSTRTSSSPKLLTSAQCHSAHNAHILNT